MNLSSRDGGCGTIFEDQRWSRELHKSGVAE